jgi:hypothetical protein
MAEAEVSLVQNSVDASRLLYDTLFLSYVASRYAQEVRCTTKFEIFSSSASWQGDPLARPRCIPSAIGAAQVFSLHAPIDDRCVGRSRVRVLAPDTRQSGTRSCSPDAPMTEGEFSPSGHH